ncbi:MAG: porin [Vicinamibacterales bacterium]
MSGRYRLTRSSAFAALLVPAILASSVVSSAQGLYYKEIRKDGRIYVFNIAANAERFERSGEAGVGVTRTGAGPAGETVVGDNERALQLFFFKHGISEPVPEPPAPVQTVAWRDGKTRITTDAAYLEISSRVQVRFTGELPDDRTQVAGTAKAGDPRGSFRIRRAKFKLEGWISRPWLTYETQVNFPGVTGSNPGALLEDAAFDVDLTKGRGLLRMHAGQFKVPFGAQELTSSGNQQFVDRALASNAFFRGRDTGLAVWGATPDNRIEWRFGIFNGSGLTRSANDNAAFQYNARVMWQPNGSQALNQRAWVTGALYSESDFESTTTPIYAVGLNWENQDNHHATSGNDQKWNAVTIDGIFKFRGFSLNGMYCWAERQPEIGESFGSSGGFIQAGKLFSRRRFEVAFRYGEHGPGDRVARNNTREVRAALNYYHLRHGLKWQTDVGHVELQAGAANPPVKTVELRSQLQFVF